MTFGWINAVNAVFVIVLIAVSVTGQKKSGVPAMESHQKLLNILEQAGRYASMVLMIMPLLPGWEFGFSSERAMIVWLVLPVVLLAAYALLWTKAKKGGGAFYCRAALAGVFSVFSDGSLTVRFSASARALKAQCTRPATGAGYFTFSVKCISPPLSGERASSIRKHSYFSMAF